MLDCSRARVCRRLHRFKPIGSGKYGLLLLGLSACTSIPDRRYAIRSIDVEGNSAIGADEIEESMASRESPRFLGFFGGVLYDHQVFNRYVLEADLQRIERYYRSRGFYRARVRAGRVAYWGDRHVKVSIIVEEGAPVVVGRVDVHGLDGLELPLATECREASLLVLGVGDRFEEEQFAETSEGIRRVLSDQGYAYASVRRRARVDLPRSLASVGYWVTPGPRARFGEVTIEGLGPIPEAPVRRALDITRGEPYSESALESAEQAVLGLGVFSSVSVKPDLPRRGRRKARRNAEALPTSVPVRVVVAPSKLRSVRLGGGLHADTLRTDVHLTVGWEHRNLLGGLQNFLIEAVPGIVLYPTRIPELEAPDRLLLQGRVRSELRQPSFLEARTNALLRAQASVYPVLLSQDPDPGAPILGYQDFRVGAGLERQYKRLYGSLSHNVQVSRPFTYAGTLDPDLGTAIVSYPELLNKLDFRDDDVQPHSGAYFQNTLQAAGVGGDARDVKIEPEARFFVPLGRHLTLALRGALGFLFAQNYGDTVAPNAATGQPGDATRAEWVEDVQLMFLRGLFSGGPISNRGYRAREIGPHGVVPFFNPGQSSAEISGSCLPDSPDFSRARCELPLGGFTLWEASIELRFPLLGPLRGALFTDASDVSPELVSFRFDRPHLSSGFGFRYETPVGPIRLDIGYRIPGVQAPADASGEGVPDETFGLPIAVALGIGVPF